MNIAGRLLSIYERLMSHQLGNDALMLKVWAKVFEVSEEESNLEDAVVTCLQATRSEMELLRSRLSSMDVAEDLMRPGMARLRNYTSAANINVNWGGFRDEAIRPENRLFFMWADWALRDESEDDLSAEDLASLKDEIDSLELALRASDMSPYLRAFVQRQVDVIRMALRVYRVQGVKPIEDALKQVAGAYTVDRARVEAEHAKASNSAKGIVERAVTLIKKTSEVADSVSKIEKAVDGGVTLAERLGPILLEWFK